jgi:very-short-patch-repair endonuclease
MRLDEQIEALATRQHSLVAVFQLTALGIQDRELYRLRQSTRWMALTPRVLAARVGVDTPDRAAMAAVLDSSPGGVLSRASAAAVWGAPGFRLAPHEVTRHRGIARRTSPLARVHEVIDLRPHHVKLIRGIPITSPGRTVFDLAAVCHEARLDRLVDWFWNERLLDGRAIDQIVSELGRRGRTGSAAMREIAAVRGPGYVPPASSLERRFEQVLQDRGLGGMRRQVDVGGEEWTGRVDFRHASLPLVVEVQSEKHHASLVDQTSDERRRAHLELAGFIVVEVWDTEVWHDPDEAARRVREGMRDARALTAKPG